MARVSLSLYEEERLPVEIRSESFTFGEIVCLNIGGFTTSDMVSLHLRPAHLSQIGAAIAAYREKRAAGGRDAAG